jgi:serine/threonine protein kinase
MTSEDYINSVEHDLSNSQNTLDDLRNITLQGLIYKSNYSQVFKVRDNLTNEWYTLKAIDKKSMLKIDGQGLKDIDHPKIAKVVAFSETDNYYYVLKPFITGMSLTTYVKERTCLKSDQVKDLLKQIADVLKYLHSPCRNIVYRDIKPDNMVISPRGQLYFIDIETIRIIKARQNSDTIHIASEGYTAPEQYGYSQTDRRSDIYALGASLFFMLTGQAPKDLNSNHESNLYKKINKLDQPWPRILRKCLAFSPKNRYQTVEELMRDVDTRLLGRKHILFQSLKTLCFIMVSFILWLSSGYELSSSEESILYHEEIQVKKNLEDQPNTSIESKSTEPLDLYSPYYKYNFKGNVETLSLEDGTYPIYVIVSNGRRFINQTGSDYVVINNENGNFDIIFPHEPISLDKGQTYTYTAYVDDKIQNRILDEGELYSENIKVYQGNTKENLTFDQWKIYSKNETLSDSEGDGLAETLDFYHNFLLKGSNIPLEGRYRMYISITNKAGKSNQTGGWVTIEDGKAELLTEMPKSSIDLKDKESYDLRIFIDGIDKDEKVNNGELYGQKEIIYNSPEDLVIEIESWEIYIDD